MAILNKLIGVTVKSLEKSGYISSKTIRYTVTNNVLARTMSNNMVIQASRWQWHKTKDMVHFYFLVGAIPLGIVTFCVNVFIGPATLAPIPESYEPKYWEYYRHPITRFLARYVYSNPQKDYEKVLHYIDDESKIIKIRQLEDKVWKLQAERQDYKYNHFLPYDNTASRDFREFLKRDRDNLDY